MPAALRAQGIDPLVDLPGVGGDLQEHPMTYVSFSARDSLLTTLRMDTMALALAQWIVDRKGALSGNGASGNLLMRTQAGTSTGPISRSC